MAHPDYSNLRLSEADFDRDGNLKPLPNKFEFDALYERSQSDLPRPIPDSFWLTRRRPDLGPERKLTHLEQLRVDATKKSFEAELAELRKHKSGMWLFDYFLEEHLQLDTRVQIRKVGRKADGTLIKKKVFASNNTPDGVRLPSGYYNYKTHQIETLPEQSLLSLVGYYWSDEKELLQAKIRQVYQNDEMKFMSRSALSKKVSTQEYKKYVRQLQTQWSRDLERPVSEIAQIQDFLIDITDMNYEDMDFLFSENFAVSPALLDIPVNAMMNTIAAIKDDDGITFGKDLGQILRNCPEMLTLSPDIIMDRKMSFIGFGFEVRSKCPFSQVLKTAKL